MNTLEKEILLVLVPVILLCAGGILAQVVRPGAGFKSKILHFAAGVVFSVVAVELLPDMVRLHDPFTITIGFSAGIMAMLLVKQLTTEPVESPQSPTASWSWPTLIAFGIDMLIDGLLLGIGFAAGQKEGILLAIALALECFSLGIAVVTTLRGSKASRVTIVLALLSLIFIGGAIAGSLLLHNASDRIMEAILSFGAAALLYLVTEELLVEAHEEKDSPFNTALFFAGFLIFLILGIVM